MGTLKQGKTKETSRVELLEGFDSLRSLLSGIAEEVDRGILQAEAISRSLIRKAVEVSNQLRTDESAPSLRETIDEMYVDKIQNQLQ